MLGLTEVAKPAGVADTGGAWFACGAQQLHVGVQDPFLASRKAHPGLRGRRPGEPRRLAERLMSAGSPVRWDDRLEGVRRFYTEDPWGNRLELCVPAPADG